MNTGTEAPSRGRIIGAGVVGNVMEWYDFAVYGYFATVIGPLFFPAENPAVSVIAAFGAFAAGFLVRPLGGLVFGRIGDLVGRKRALTLSVLAMALPTVLIAFLPTYEAIGIAAPIILVLLRMVQGLSVGGEYTNSIVFMVEHAPPHRRGVFAVWGLWGAVLGILIGSGVGDVLASVLDEQQIAAWGWRLPFALGVLVALTGFVIRSSMGGAEAAPEETTSPVLETFGKHRGPVLRVILLNVGNGVGFYTAFVYAVSYIKEIDDLPEQLALNLNTGAMALLLLIMPLTAWLSDRVGRKPMIITGAALLLFGAIPLFELMHTTDPLLIFMGEFGFVIAMGILSGGLNAANVELMPSSVRCTGLAFAYNASIGYFGGTTPLIAAWLITATGNPIMPAFWVAATAAVTLLTAIFLIHETRYQPLT
jgi:MHS family proline/betaine transporter-like MFS transporter